VCGGEGRRGRGDWFQVEVALTEGRLGVEKVGLYGTL
jgi:hypothetical protein